MPLKRDDPWHTTPPDSRSDVEANRRYNRAVRLSEMREYIARVERMDARMQARYADGVAYRQTCLERWREYLDGEIETPIGRKMKS